MRSLTAGSAGWTGSSVNVLQQPSVVQLVWRRQTAAAEDDQLPAVVVVTWRADRWGLMKAAETDPDGEWATEPEPEARRAWISIQSEKDIETTDRRPGWCRVEPRHNTGETDLDWRRCWEEVTERLWHADPPHPPLPLPPSQALSQRQEKQFHASGERMKSNKG